MVRLGTLVLCSLLGMGASSAGVTLATSDATTAVDSAASVAAAPSRLAEPAPSQPWSQSTPKVAEREADRRGAPASFSLGDTVHVDGRVGHAVLPGSGAHETFVLIEVGADAGVAGQGRAPVNLSIVIDRSGSMKGQRLDNAVAAARGMLARLRTGDTVSMVAYDDQAELLVPPTPLERLDRFTFDRALNGLEGRGHTYISCGVDLARAQLRQRGSGVNRILLLSDGVANRGMTSPADFQRLGDATRRERTAVASIGVDVDYDERMLFALSQASNGNHYFVDDPSGLPRVFEQEVRDLVGSVADRVDVEVGLAKGVQLLEVISRGHRRDGNRVTLAFGSLGAGQERSALLRVRIDGGEGPQPVAGVRLAYRDLVGGRDRQEQGTLGVELDPELSQIAALDARVEERLGRKDTLDALLGANASFARGDVFEAQRQLARTRGQIEHRRARSKAKSGSKVDRDFDRQLEALGSAESNFQDAVKVAPAPTAAPQQRAGKKAIRSNMAVASPFG